MNELKKNFYMLAMNNIYSYGYSYVSNSEIDVSSYVKAAMDENGDTYTETTDENGIFIIKTIS